MKKKKQKQPWYGLPENGKNQVVKRGQTHSTNATISDAMFRKELEEYRKGTLKP